MLDFVVAAAISYILGSIPNGLILGKAIWGVDLRQHGSKNIGATNAWRTIGKAGGISIFALDFLKGAISAYLGLHLGAASWPVCCAASWLLPAIPGRCSLPLREARG